MSNNSLWYWKKNGKVKGPFAEGLIQKYIILRRIHPNDLMSRDKHNWQKASCIYELIPDVLRNKDADNYDERIKAAKRWADDRDSVRQNLVDDDFNQRTEVTHLGIHTLGWKMTLFIIILFVIVLGATFYFTPSKLSSTGDCSVEIKTKVNLENCDLSERIFLGLNVSHANLKNSKLRNTNLTSASFSYAHMQYSDMGNSNLTKTKFDHANLTGVTLTHSILIETDFSSANLSYANFKGAKAKNILLKGANLSKAIWFSGQECAQGSIGRCLISQTSK